MTEDPFSDERSIPFVIPTLRLAPDTPVEIECESQDNVPQTELITDEDGLEPEIVDVSDDLEDEIVGETSDEDSGNPIESPALVVEPEPLIDLTAPDTRARSLFDDTVMVSVIFKRFGTRRKLSMSLVEIDADKTLLGATKKILDCAEYKTIITHDMITRSLVMQKAVPSIIKRGSFLVRVTSVPEIESLLQQRQAERNTLVDAFMAEYDKAQENAAARLGVAYNPKDYPPAPNVRASFRLDWLYTNFGAPNQLRSISPEFFEAQRDKAEARWTEAVSEVASLLRAQFASICAKWREQLTPGEDGSTRRFFKSTTYDAITAFIENFDIRNIANDADLAALVDEAKTLMNTIPNAKTLKQSSALREQALAAFTEIGTKADSIIGESGRIVEFDEEGF